MTRELSKEEVQKISNECMEAVRAILESHGLVLSDRYRTSWDGHGFSTKFEAAVVNDNGIVEDRYAQEFKAWSRLLDMDPSDLGREFTTRTGTYRLTGYNSRATKMPFLAVNVATGKTYKFTEAAVKFALAKAGAA